MLKRLSILLLSVCVAAHAQKPIGEVRTTDANVKGSVVLGKEGAVLMSGSQVQAGTVSAEIELARGGKVQVCPGSTVSVTASVSGEELMFAMSSGTIETHYKLAARSDAILTPDFRIQLSGPGTFHLAVNIHKNGDTCVESMKGNTSASIATETFGDGTYQIQPGKSVTFHNGHVDGVTENATINSTSSCGCPPPASIAPPPQFDPGLNFPKDESERAAKNVSEGKPVENPSTPLDQALPGKVYAKIDAPMVFDSSTAPPAPKQQPASSTPSPAMPDPYPKVTAPPPGPAAGSVQPADAAPQPTKEAPKKKWFQKLGSAIARFFKSDKSDTPEKQSN